MQVTQICKEKDVPTHHCKDSPLQRLTIVKTHHCEDSPLWSGGQRFWQRWSLRGSETEWNFSGNRNPPRSRSSPTGRRFQVSGWRGWVRGEPWNIFKLLLNCGTVHMAYTIWYAMQAWYFLVFRPGDHYHHIHHCFCHIFEMNKAMKLFWSHKDIVMTFDFHLVDVFQTLLDVQYRSFPNS